MLRRSFPKHNHVAILRHTRTPIRRHVSSKPPQEPQSRPRFLSRLFHPVRDYYKNSETLDLMKFYLTYSLAFLLFWHIEFNYFYQYGLCEGISMLPTLESFGDHVLISTYYRRGRGVEVGDLVSYAHPIHSEERAVKRVIGLPGDFVGRDTPGVGGGVMIQVGREDCRRRNMMETLC